MSCFVVVLEMLYSRDETCRQPPTAAVFQLSFKDFTSDSDLLQAFGDSESCLHVVYPRTEVRKSMKENAGKIPGN